MRPHRFASSVLALGAMLVALPVALEAQATFAPVAVPAARYHALPRWDAQEGVPGRGDVVLKPATWHSIELQSTSPIPEWGGTPASCRQDEEAYPYAAGERHWILRRQERFHLVW